MKLTDKQIFDVAERHLPGKAHKVISSTDPDYAKAVEIPDGARWIASEVHPEHTLSFARAIESTVRQQYEPVLKQLVRDIAQAHDLSLDGDHYAGRNVLTDVLTRAQQWLDKSSPGKTD